MPPRLDTAISCIKGHILAVSGIYTIRRKDGRTEAWCKRCNSIRTMARYHERMLDTTYVEERRRQAAKWRNNNRDKVRQATKGWYKSASEEVKDRARARGRARHKKRQQEDPSYRAAALLRVKAWNKKNPEKRRQLDIASVNARRARIGGSTGRVAEDDIAKLLLRQHSRCANVACNFLIGYRQISRSGKIVVRKLHRDHVLPLALNGLNVIDNIQLLCQKCNARKHTLTQEEFARRSGVLF